MTDNTKRTERIEVKWFERATFDLRSNISRENLGFAKSELRGRRDGFVGLCVEHGRAIAERPESRVAGNGEGRVNGERATLVFGERQILDDRIGGDTSGPDERFGWDFAVGQNDEARLCVAQARFQTEDDAALGHALLS